MTPFTFNPAAPAVDVWDYVEIAATGSPDVAANPFTTITLTGIFIDPTGDSTSVMGFCDAQDGTVFRIRFLPQIAGAHEYRLTLCVGETVAATYRGSFVATANPARILPVDRDPAHPAHFVYRGTDTHFFWNGTTAYALLGLSDDLMNRALDRLQKHGVNRVRFALSSARVESGEKWFEKVFPSPEFSFLLNPWVAERPDSIADPGFDTSRFDTAFWQKADRALLACRERGIVASVIFYLDGLLPGVDPFGKERAGSDDEKRFYAYAAARLSAFANLHWDVTNEYRLIRDDTWVREMAPFLKAYDPVKHTLSVHGHGDFVFGGEPWCDYACYQSWDEWGGYDYMIANRARQAETGRIVPQVNEEYGYEDHYPQGWGESHVAPTRNAETRRLIAWEIYMAGGYQTTGEAAPPFGGWLNGLAPDDHTEMLDGNYRARRFFESFDWWRCVPAPEVIAPPSDKAFCLADVGRTYALWLPGGGAVTITLPTGTYTGRWFHPRSDAGFSWPFAVAGGDVRLAAPGKGGDWALLVTQSEH